MSQEDGEEMERLRDENASLKRTVENLQVFPINCIKNIFLLKNVSLGQGEGPDRLQGLLQVPAVNQGFLRRMRGKFWTVMISFFELLCSPVVPTLFCIWRDNNKGKQDQSSSLASAESLFGKSVAFQNTSRPCQNLMRSCVQKKLMPLLSPYIFVSFIIYLEWQPLLHGELLVDVQVAVVVGFERLPIGVERGAALARQEVQNHLVEPLIYVCGGKISELKKMFFFLTSLRPPRPPSTWARRGTRRSQRSKKKKPFFSNSLIFSTNKN